MKSSRSSKTKKKPTNFFLESKEATMSCCFKGIFLCLLLIMIHVETKAVTSSSPYLSPSLFFPKYQKMLQTLTIFVYQPNPTTPQTHSVESLFHASLIKSPFLTTDPNQAHLFYLLLPSNSSSSSRSISRSIKHLRTDLPFWNRTLGADHFYVSCNGLGYESDRNIVELKKNSVQISCFPSLDQGNPNFIPHKDLTLPPLYPNSIQQVPINSVVEFLCYFNGNRAQIPEFGAAVLKQLRNDSDFLIESGSVGRARFCLFFYGGDFSGVGEALRYGCVPVVMTDGRPILDLPFMDVLTWSDIAVFVGTEGGVKETKRRMVSTCGEKYQRMKEMGRKASKHFEWNETPQPYDAFHTVLYQLWTRRHTVGYAMRETSIE